MDRITASTCELTFVSLSSAASQGKSVPGISGLDYERVLNVSSRAAGGASFVGRFVTVEVVQTSLCRISVCHFMSSSHSLPRLFK